MPLGQVERLTATAGVGLERSGTEEHLRVQPITVGPLSLDVKEVSLSHHNDGLLQM